MVVKKVGDLLKVIFVVLFIMSLSIFGCTSQQESTTAAQKNCKEVQTPYEEQEEYLKTEYYTETVPYTDKECENVAYKYTRDETTCEREGWIGDWTVVSCAVTNLDEQGGTFTASIGVTISGQNVGEEQNEYIYSQKSYTFEYKIKADASSCYCSLTNIPQKQVCRDVTKYKDVQKTRQVTAYRPVTKYRTETGCE